MSSLGSPNPLLFGAAKDYEIERSLRFHQDDSAALTRTPSSAGNRKTWTFSCWMKRSELFAAGSYQAIFGTGTFMTGSSWGGIYLDNYDQLVIFDNTVTQAVYTSYKLRDTSAWYHVVCKCDLTDASTNFYINGVLQTAYATNNKGSNSDGNVNNTTEHYIGRDSGGNYFAGYLAEIHFADGQALAASSFGETNEGTGAWVPKKYAGSYGTNGFYLNFSDNSGTTATTLGKDSAGSNNWTPNNFSVAAGAGNDSVEDTPTNNYCVLNPLFPNGTEAPGTISDGSLKFVGSGYEYAMCPSTMTIQNGKYYWEVTHGGGSYVYVGIIRGTSCGADCYISYDPEGNVFGIGYNQDGKINGAGPGGSTNGATSSTAPNSYTTNDVIGIATDIPSGTIKWYKNNTLEHTITGLNNETWFPAVSAYSNGGTALVNFGQQAFSYTPPTGHVALCTANLPEPTIKKGSDHFYTKVYAPDGSASFAVTGVGFQPDLVWLKSREYAEDHQLNDSARGATKGLQSNLLAIETTQSNGLISFDSDGFTVGNLSDYNYNGDSIVSWNWKESATAGFDIVKDEGTGSDHTIPHSLGVKPDMMIRKAIDRVDNWMVYHKDLDGADATEYLQLNEAAGQANYHEIWNDTPPTNLVFTVGSDTAVNEDDKNYITYLFTSIEGFSKAGKYEGNGNANGPFIYTGFKPAWVMVKVTSSTGYNWLIFDNKRIGYNQENHMLLPNESHEEKTTGYGEIDILSNGFKLRESTNDGNKSGDTIIYMAFAETPFKYANAR